MKWCVLHYLKKSIETLSIVFYLDNHQALDNRSYANEK